MKEGIPKELPFSSLDREIQSYSAPGGSGHKDGEAAREQGTCMDSHGTTVLPVCPNADYRP